MTSQSLAGLPAQHPEAWGDFEQLEIGSHQLEALQVEKLKKLLTYAYERSPLYRQRFDDAGVNPADFSSLADYAAYPMFDKALERDSQAQSLAEHGHPMGMHLCCDITEVNRISASSGTTGTPSFQGHTANDRKIQSVNLARMLQMVGIAPGDRVLYAGVMSMWVAGIPTIDGLLDYGAMVIPIGGLVGGAKVAEMIQLTRPDAVCCTPSFARHLVNTSGPETGVDLSACGVRCLLVYGEPGGSVPEIVTELNEGFGGADVFDMSGGTSALNPIFVSCPAHAGLHFIAPDHAYIELYDRSTDTLLDLVDGAVGEFVYTGMDRECGPLIRFMDGDLMRVHRTPCECGLPGMRIEILGRVDDMLLVKGVNVFPSAVRDVVIGLDDRVTGNIRVVKSPGSAVVEGALPVMVECAGAPSAADKATLASDLAAEIQRVLRFKPSIELFDEGTIPMEQGATGKTKLVLER